MANNGRPPIPAKLARGTDTVEYHETKERIENNLVTKSELKCPKYLSIEAKKEWKRVMKLYKEMNADILSNLDEVPLIIYCEATAIYKKAQEIWVENQAVATTDPRSQKILDKTFKTMEKQAQIISKYASELCLTPVGRAKMGVNPADKKTPDAFDKMLAKFGE